MTPERFRQVRNLFEAALEKHPAERDMFVCEAAQSDEGLRAEVDRMLVLTIAPLPFLTAPKRRRWSCVPTRQEWKGGI